MSLICHPTLILSTSRRSSAPALPCTKPEIYQCQAGRLGCHLRSWRSGSPGVQYAKAMGFHVAAVDVSEEKLALPVSSVQSSPSTPKSKIPLPSSRRKSRSNAVLVTAVSTGAFAQAIGMARPRATIALNGLPPGSFPCPYLKCAESPNHSGSIVGTRLDLAEALSFAKEGLVHATVATAKLEDINDVFKRMPCGHDRRAHCARLSFITTIITIRTLTVTIVAACTWDR